MILNFDFQLGGRNKNDCAYRICKFVFDRDPAKEIFFISDPAKLFFEK